MEGHAGVHVVRPVLQEATQDDPDAVREGESALVQAHSRPGSLCHAVQFPQRPEGHGPSHSPVCSTIHARNKSLTWPSSAIRRQLYWRSPMGGAFSPRMTSCSRLLKLSRPSCATRVVLPSWKYRRFVRRLILNAMHIDVYMIASVEYLPSWFPGAWFVNYIKGTSSTLKEPQTVVLINR